jgi:hypothetical protein
MAFQMTYGREPEIEVKKKEAANWGGLVTWLLSSTASALLD